MPSPKIRQFLDEGGAKYAVINHSPAFTAQEVAASAHVPGKALAKTVIVKLDNELAIAVVPATQQLNFDLLKAAAGAKTGMLASEPEFMRRFPDCEVGAIPPFGRSYDLPLYVEKDLAKEEHIAFCAGTHRDVIAMKFADYRRVAHPRLARIGTVSEPEEALCFDCT